MIQQLQPEIIYPESDGQPMADNTEQFNWIVIIKENLERLFAGIVNVFIAGNLLWYPVQGSLQSMAPDVMVIFGRPKGKRGSYQQWLEENIHPQVVFEILSPSNKATEMSNKFLLYQQYGVEEYYIYYPQRVELSGFLRRGDVLEAIDQIQGWVSPRLGIRFELTPDTLEIYRPDGEKFLTSIELDQLTQQERQRAEQERQRAEQERQRAEQERQRAEQERQRAEQTMTQLEQERQRADQTMTQLEQERQNYQDLLALLQAKGIDLEKL